MMKYVAVFIMMVLFVGICSAEINVATGAKVFAGSAYKQTTLLTDGDVSNGLELNQHLYTFIMDLDNASYIGQMKIYLKVKQLIKDKSAISVKYSEDIINWKEVDKRVVESNNQYILFDFSNVATRFLKFSIDHRYISEVKEVELYKEKEYELKISGIEVEVVDDNSVRIKCKSTKPTTAQVVYENEKNFLYYSKLSSVALNVKAGMEHNILITGLNKNNNYRYQIVLSDFNNKQVKSEVLGFSTSTDNE